MRQMPLIRLPDALDGRKVAVLSQRRNAMTTKLNFEFLDNTLYLLLLFVPVNLLLAGAVALATAPAQ